MIFIFWLTSIQKINVSSEWTKRNSYKIFCLDSWHRNTELRNVKIAACSCAPISFWHLRIWHSLQTFLKSVRERAELFHSAADLCSRHYHKYLMLHWHRSPAEHINISSSDPLLFLTRLVSRWQWRNGLSDFHPSCMKEVSEGGASCLQWVFNPKPQARAKQSYKVLLRTVCWNGSGLRSCYFADLPRLRVALSSFFFSCSYLRRTKSKLAVVDMA